MQICIFGSSFLPAVGGKEFVMHNLANALVKNGHDVTVIAKRVSWRKSSETRDYDLKLYSLPVKGSGRIGLDYLSSILTFITTNLQKRFDVINCHGVDDSGSRAMTIRSLTGIPLVMTPHGIDVQRIPDIGYGLRLNAKWDRIITKNLRSANFVTAISRSVREELDMISESLIIDIPNGIEASRFSGQPSTFLHEVLNIPSNHKIVLSVGRNHVKKGYDYGIKAMSVLFAKFGIRNVHYVVVGRGVSAHEKTVEKCNAGAYVSLIEEFSPDKITKCYKSADIFFSPSLVEGLSLVSIEAMASGLPLVVTNVPGNDDVVRDNGCGLVVQSTDVDSMADGLFQLISNDERRRNLADLALQCSQKYDWSRIAEQYEEAYRKAVQDNSRQ